MTFWRDAGSRGWSYVNFDTTLRAVNRAFDGPVDTSGYMAGMMITGVHPLVDFPFLHPNPGALPLKIEPARTPWEEIPVQFALRQNYPNPFNPSTTIAFDIAVPSLVTLKIYNILGQEVAAPVSNEYMDEGNYDVEFNANALASGVYFYRIVADAVGSDDELIPAGAFVQVKKMLLVK
jgi:hypothetical protein